MKCTGYNLILDTDSYKIGGHWNMYPGTEGYINSYFECRSGAKFDESVFFGLQFLLKQLEGVVVTPRDVDEAAEYCRYHFGNDDAFNFYGWMYIATNCGGKLPIEIQAVPEGTVVGKSNVLLQIRNTDPKCRWLVGYLETMLSRIWYPITVATKSREVKKIIKNFWNLTSDQGPDAFGINFCLHDFGGRSVTSYDAGGIGGTAHLVNFMGTDTVQALRFAKDFYNADLSKLAFSVPASEHSIMTINMREGEEGIFQDLIAKYPTGILSIVSDSYNIYEFTSTVAERNKEAILARDGKLVFRPDSGDPVAVTLAVLENLWKVFGGTTNEKGYRVLNPKVGCLWGDGIDTDGIENILLNMQWNGFSAENIVFGMGSALTQKLNRDTMACAFKACAKMFDDDADWVDVFKDPVGASDNSSFTKKSKRGVLALIEDPGGTGYRTERLDKLPHGARNLLQPVFRNGVILKEYNFEEVRANCNKY